MLAFLWGGARWPPTRVENEDYILAMREDLEAHGNFACKLDGTMEFIDFLTFRSIISRHACRKNYNEKQELRKKQHQAFLDEDWKSYGQHIRGRNSLSHSIQALVEDACDWINYDVELYLKTVKEVKTDPELNQKMVLRDQDVNHTYEKQRFQPTLTKQQTVEAYMFSLQIGMKAWRRMQAYNFTVGQNEREALNALESQKNSDRLLQKYLVDAEGLTLHQEHYRLMEDNRLRQMQRMIGKQREDEQSKEVASCQPEQKLATEMIKRGTLSGGPFAEDETYLTFDWFLQGEKIVTEYAVRHSLQEAAKHNEARRLALKEERMDDYQWEIHNQRNREMLTHKLLQANFNQTLKTPKRMFTATEEKVNADPQLSKTFYKALNEVRTRVRLDWLNQQPFREIPKDEVISKYEKFRTLEIFNKLRIIKELTSKKIPQNQTKLFVECSNRKMHDIYANQNEGYEERDIAKSIIKHNLENDPAYLAVKQAKDKEWQDIIEKRSAALAEMKSKMILESK